MEPRCTGPTREAPHGEWTTWTIWTRRCQTRPLLWGPWHARHALPLFHAPRGYHQTKPTAISTVGADPCGRPQVVVPAWGSDRRVGSRLRCGQGQALPLRREGCINALLSGTGGMPLSTVGAVPCGRPCGAVEVLDAGRVKPCPYTIQSSRPAAFLDGGTRDGFSLSNDHCAGLFTMYSRMRSSDPSLRITWS